MKERTEVKIWPDAVIRKGLRFWGYEVIDYIESGGISDIYLCKNIDTGHSVILKILQPCHQKVKLIRERFGEASKIVHELGKHPNIANYENSGYVKQSDDGESIDRCAFFMEYIQGEDLRKYIFLKKRLSLKEAINILEQVCDALHHLHIKNIVHRDIKPSNIIIEESGRAVLIDFDIAKKLGSDMTAIYQPGARLGDQSYMSPEQAAGEPVDHRTDIYPLGLMLFEMIEGKHLVTTQRKNVPNLGSGIYKKVQSIIKKAISENPGDRYNSTTDFIKDLKWARKLPIVISSIFIIVCCVGFYFGWTLLKNPANKNNVINQVKDVRRSVVDSMTIVEKGTLSLNSMPSISGNITINHQESEWDTLIHKIDKSIQIELPPGQYDITGRIPHYVNINEKFNIKAGYDTEVTLKPIQLGVLKVVVSPYSAIWINNKEMKSMDSIFEGEYPPGEKIEVKLVNPHTGFYSETLEIKSGNNNVVEKEFEKGTLVVLIKGRSKQIMEGFTVFLNGIKKDQTRMELFDGQYTVKVWKDGFESESKIDSQTVEIRPDTVTTVEFTMMPR